jgi:hypothetical protein
MSAEGEGVQSSNDTLSGLGNTAPLPCELVAKFAFSSDSFGKNLVVAHRQAEK